MRVELIYCIL